jgi:mono/diheme cytochrome c family protein
MHLKKTNMKRKLILGSSVLAVCIMSLAFTIIQQPKPWPVPEKNAKMANPIKSNAESISAGKALWSRHCISCHGKKGLGDGSKAAQLKTTPQDMTLGTFQSQSDGAIFYKTSEGRDDMPSFKKKIPDPEDIWDLVNFIRTLKK